MAVCKAVVSAVFLIATLNKVPAKPQSSLIRERHIIHAPINFRVIHHYKIKKVPIVIRKHLHYHETHTERIRPILEEVRAYRDDSNGVWPQIEARPHEAQDGKKYSAYAGIHLTDDGKGPAPQEGGKGYSFRGHVQQQQSPPEDYEDSQEEDYQGVEDSREDYDDYE